MYLHFVFVLHQEHISCGQDAPHQLPQLRLKYNVHICVYSTHVCTCVYIYIEDAPHQLLAAMTPHRLKLAGGSLYSVESTRSI